MNSGRRAQVIHNVTTTGTHRIMNYGSTSSTTSSTPITLNGTIPEPAAALLGSLGMLGLLRRRR